MQSHIPWHTQGEEQQQLKEKHYLYYLHCSDCYPQTIVSIIFHEFQPTLLLAAQSINAKVSL